MIKSRNTQDLLPYVQTMVNKWLALCKSSNLNILIYSTYRDNEAQNAEYAKGRTIPGTKITTKAKAGMSYHQYRIALDFVPVINGKPAWGDKESYQLAAKLAKSVGLSWAGDWKNAFEQAHLQYDVGGKLTIQMLKNGATIDNEGNIVLV